MGGGLGDRERSKRGAEKRNKQGKNGTKGQLFITVRIGAGGPDINWCGANQRQQTHTHNTTNTIQTQVRRLYLLCVGC